MRIEPATSPSQFDLLEHALGLRGLPVDRRPRALERCGRDFIVGVRDSAAWPDLVELAARRLLRRIDTSCSVGTAVFVVTEAGFDVLRAHGRVPAIQQELFPEGVSDAG